jgi:hypothetical protein
MTAADLDRRSAEVASLAADAMRDAGRRIDRAMDAAYNHAIKALTETLRATDPGRASIRKARSSPSYQAALSDLDALLSKLCGPSVAANIGTLRDARERCYRSSLAWWSGVLPADKAMPDATPTPSRIAHVRGLVLHGYDLRAEVGGRVKQVGSSLLATLERASKPGVLDGDAIGLIDGWSAASRTTLNLTVQTAIGDAATAIEGIAANDAIRPEFRAVDEFAPPED